MAIDGASLFREQLAAAYAELDRLEAIMVATAQLMASGQADKNDGYRITNALLDMRALARRQEDLYGIVLAGDMEPNAGLHMMAFRALWAMLDSRITVLLAQYPGGDVAPVRDMVGQLRQVRTDIEALVPGK